jgi:N-methylhydantoinase A/oxoprolinase/acetone carboxylase beta subunit
MWIFDFFSFSRSFSMPDVYSVGLGGGSKVREDLSGNVTVGPDSVGHYVCFLFPPLRHLLGLTQ